MSLLPLRTHCRVALVHFHGSQPYVRKRFSRCARSIWTLPILLIIVASYSQAAQSSATAPVRPIRRILSISSLGPSYPSTIRVDEAIRTALDESPYQIELYHEYLDTILFPEESTQEKFRNWYVAKYRDRQPDII